MAARAGSVGGTAEESQPGPTRPGIPSPSCSEESIWDFFTERPPSVKGYGCTFTRKNFAASAVE